MKQASQISSARSGSKTIPAKLRTLIPANPAALQFCWHIRVGLFRKIEPVKIRQYAGFFYRTYLDEHLCAQEQLMMGCTGISETVVKKALTYHRRLRRLFESNSDPCQTLSKIEDVLEQHVRFEQKVLFTAIYVEYVQTGRDTSKLVRQFYAPSLQKKLNTWADRYWTLD